MFPVYIGEILRGVHKTLPILYRRNFVWGMQNILHIYRRDLRGVRKTFI